MKRVVAALVALLISMLARQTAVSAIVAVPPGPGTPIQNAIDAAEPGDVIALGLGTYAESIVVTKPLTIIGPATLEDDDCSRAVLVTVAADGVRLRDLFLGGGSFAAVEVQGRHDVRLERLVFRPGRFLLGACAYRPDYAVHVAASSAMRITGSEAIGTSALGGYAAAIVVLTDIPTYGDVRVTGNYFAFEAPAGILVKGSIASLEHRAMRKGVSIVRNTLGGPWTNAIELRASHGVYVASNFVANALQAPGIGVRIDAASGNTLVKANRFASNFYDVVTGFNDCVLHNRTDQLQRCLW